MCSPSPSSIDRSPASASPPPDVIPYPGFSAPPINSASQSWGSSDYDVVRSPGTYSSDPHITGGAGCYFLAGGVYTFQSGFTINGGFVSNELRPPDEPALAITTAAL